MKKTEKSGAVESLKGALASQKGAVVAEYRGLTVLEVTGLRKKLRAANAEFRIVKNTLMRLAAKETPFSQLDAAFKGPTAVAFAHGDPVALAKVMKEFAAASPKVTIKAGYLDGKVLSTAEVSALADVPPREVLLARLARGLMGPLSGFAQVLSGPQRKLAYALQAIHDQKS